MEEEMAPIDGRSFFKQVKSRIQPHKYLRFLDLIKLVVQQPDNPDQNHQLLETIANEIFTEDQADLIPILERIML
jgi:hypothetical protein